MTKATDQPQNDVRKWQFWIDRGGTFTDIVAQRPDGQLCTHKLLSENPQHYRDAAIEGIRQLQLAAVDQPTAIASVKMGTTVATNALLEGKSNPTLLVLSHGLRDQLRIGYQTRSDIFALNIDQPEPLYQAVIEAPERVLADGRIELPLDEEATLTLLQQAHDQGCRSIAVVLMHAYKYPQHELHIAALARQVGFQQISLSHQVSPLIKLVPRGDTTVADAYLSPVLSHYVEQVQQALAAHCQSLQTDFSEPLEQPKLEFMQSNGGLTDARSFSGRDAILSGPAGGVVGMVKTAQADGFQRLLGFDMGGTSTDVSHYAGELERQSETELMGVRLRAPMMNIHTVAAGGGSIVSFREGRLQVGPESAGANPGPACYRQGGPLTITDCNLLLGRIQADHFPCVFGPQQDQPLDLYGVQQSFKQLALEVTATTGVSYSAESLAMGFLQVAVENMAAAIKKISVQRGYDIQGYTLAAFGGAGGQHACAVADALGVKQIYLHPMAGVLSAFGIGIADQRWMEEAPIEQSLAGAHRPIEQALEQLLQRYRRRYGEPTYLSDNVVINPLAAGHQQGAAALELQLRLYLRYQGSDTPLLVNMPLPDHIGLDQSCIDLDYIAAQTGVLTQDFEHQHQALFGFCYPEKELLVDALQLEVVVSSGELPSAQQYSPSQTAVTDKPRATDVKIYCLKQPNLKDQLSTSVSAIDWHKVTLLNRQTLVPQQRIKGPLLLTDANSTLWIEDGWQVGCLPSGALLIDKIGGAEVVTAVTHGAEQQADLKAPDPVQLEIFNNLFMSVAEQMGFVLEKTASSVNIKERLDFSCAIFDRHGALVANAPHIPVHLGSMSESIEVVINGHPKMQPGDAFVLNTPYNGGTHLPDITVVKPVFIGSQTDDGADFYVAARGHHADIGGITPGSMPATSTHIEQEGVLLDNLPLVRNGQFLQEEILHVLSAGAFPARNPTQNIADLQAQIAACEKGAQELQRLCDCYGRHQVQAYMAFVQDNAEQSLRACLAQISSGRHQLQADDGTSYCVDIQVDSTSGSAVVDFSGTGYRPDQAQHPGNFNAPTSVVKAAVLYSFRLLVNKPIPLNSGFFRALEIKVPEASIVAPVYPAAVVSGNVETAQCLVNCLMSALGLMANSQGTNNNLTFGNDQYQYYETLCGGAGATGQSQGADAVHTHMTNSRLTDPEILEQRYPVVLDHFHIRHLSGGTGQHRGGDGVERHIRMLEKMRVNVISGQRLQQPQGLLAGGKGRTGCNFVMRHTGKIDWLAGCADIELDIGDRICIHTPGGGGFSALEAGANDD